MRNLPIELHFEIEKFLKNKIEVFTMYCLVLDNNAYEFTKRKLSISYICTSLKLLKWYKQNNFKLISDIFRYVLKKMF
jgi:hypothetical protein